MIHPSCPEIPTGIVANMAQPGNFSETAGLLRITSETVLAILISGALAGLALLALLGLYQLLLSPLRTFWSSIRMRYLYRQSGRRWQKGREIVKNENNLMRKNELFYLIAGLGNPGRKYRDTRHNIGFMAVDQIAQRCGLLLNRVEQNAIITKGSLLKKKIILAKPQTFMNESGRAVATLARYYHIEPDRIITICDDLDLPYGKIRLRPAGGSGGHKGLSSIAQHLGTQDFARLRIGIGRPPGQMDPADYVMHRFTKSEQPDLDILLVTIAECVELFLTEGIEAAMNCFNPGQVL